MASTQHRGGSGNFAANPERAAQAGRKGGRMSGGNFRNNPERAAQAGQKGGQASGGNFRNDPKRASQAGRKGGQETTQAVETDAQPPQPEGAPAIDITGVSPDPADKREDEPREASGKEAGDASPSRDR